MKFLLDENVDYRLATYLTHAGHDVKAISHDYPYAEKDKNVLAIAYKESRILLTNDKGDFGELIFRHHHPHSGVILFRFKRGDIDIEIRRERLQHVLTNYSNQLHNFIVVTRDKIRVRIPMPKQKEAA
jgi:predicted nuclease of predicted toxin-antitoxin system